MMSLLITILNKSITRSNKRKSYHKNKAMEVLKNVMSFFCFIFLSKKFIIQKTYIFLLLLLLLYPPHPI